MFSLFKKILWDETAFERYARTALFVVGQLIDKGAIVLPPHLAWIGIVMSGLALMIAAGEKNAPQG